VYKEKKKMQKTIFIAGKKKFRRENNGRAPEKGEKKQRREGRRVGGVRAREPAPCVGSIFWKKKNFWARKKSRRKGGIRMTREEVRSGLG